MTPAVATRSATTTLINSLRYQDKQFGLETMCVGGGQGTAMVLS